MRPSTSETNGAVNNTKPKSNNAPSDANTALTPGAGAAQTDSATSHVNDVSPHSDKQSHSENSNQGQQHALHANVNAKPTDTSIQAAGLASQTTPTFTTELEQVQHTPSGTPLLAQVPLDALAVQIARRFEQGISKFDISLHPADLGKLEISLNVSDDGRVQAVLRAERSDTLDLLRQDSRALENQLRQAGLEVGSNALSFQLSQGNGNRQNLNASHAFRGDESLEAGDATQASTSQYIAVRKRDGLDIHV